MGAIELLLIGLGGALGSVLRSLSSFYFQDLHPWPTLFVNLIGAFLVGLLVKIMEQQSSPDTFRAFWIVGFCGGFTTFSAFSFELLEFLRSSQWSMGLIYGIVSFVGSIASIFLAFRIFSYFYS